MKNARRHCARSNGGSKHADNHGLGARHPRDGDRARRDPTRSSRRARTAKGMFTPASVLASTKRMFEGDCDARVRVNTHRPTRQRVTKLAAALTADVVEAGAKRKALGSGRLSRSCRSSARRARSSAAPALRRSRDGEGRLRQRRHRLMLYPIRSRDQPRLCPCALRAAAQRAARRPAGRRPGRATWRWSPAASASWGRSRSTQLTAGRRMGFDFDVDDDAFVLGAARLTRPIARTSFGCSPTSSPRPAGIRRR